MRVRLKNLGSKSIKFSITTDFASANTISVPVDEEIVVRGNKLGGDGTLKVKTDEGTSDYEVTIGA